jgi:helix-turn-helix protein
MARAPRKSTAKPKAAKAEQKIAKPGPRARITGSDREKFAVQVAEQYAGGMTIREIATFHGRSFGNIHKILTEGGVTFRGRGGARA